MFNVEYSWQNAPQEGAYGVCSKDFDSLQQAYDFAAQVIARATRRNAESPLCCGMPEDSFSVDLRITKAEYEGQRLPAWQCTLLTLMYSRTTEHAMWYSQSIGEVICC